MDFRNREVSHPKTSPVLFPFLRDSEGWGKLAMF